MTTQQAEKIITASSNPLHSGQYAPKLTVKKVYSVSEPDVRDRIIEVLYRDGHGELLTAYIKDNEVISLADGW